MGKTEEMELAVKVLLKGIGEDLGREGLVDTPGRVQRSLLELCSGYAQDPAEILSTTFKAGQVYRRQDALSSGTRMESTHRVGFDGIVCLRDVELYSLCEHHMMPFVGRAHVAYIPGDHHGDSRGEVRVVGLSKLARLVECFARRLQTQERLTHQIANALIKHLGARGAAVVLEADHFCMRMRGVSKQHSTMVTSSMLGVFGEDSDARAEVMALLGVGVR